ncbi:hypothetical protein [Streptomyces sp. ML-6]|uniref:hypothetical protein n=1 Tax=unclassified Streptomyces TaxID=2593676 RepID=UPI0024BF73AE|nr:hypothetical protein [Streptomyces sp. ML-6]MDK0519137.1 hypothetical protein [Streptomyces sp. ML-6]
MTLSGCATYGQLSLFVSLLIGIAHLLGCVPTRFTPVAGPVPRPAPVRPAPLSVLRI